MLISKTADGLKRLFKIVKSHCDQLLLEINTGKGKSEVISPDGNDLDLLGDYGSLELSLKQVLQYKYLGLEMTSSILRTGIMKQKKCVNTASKYKFACFYLGKQGPDVTDVTLATWSSIAIPTIMFGCESIIFKNDIINSLERIQAHSDK